MIYGIFIIFFFTAGQTHTGGL